VIFVVLTAMIDKITIFSLLSLFSKNESRRMRSPCCVSVFLGCYDI
jgi:hypothetical protein